MKGNDDMCLRGTVTLVKVRIPADLSCTGRVKWKLKRIDSCIAPLVAALQAAGINIRGSCCGHGKRPGKIILEDGRTLVVITKNNT